MPLVYLPQPNQFFLRAVHRGWFDSDARAAHVAPRCSRAPLELVHSPASGFE
jgi:hypothetical protein